MDHPHGADDPGLRLRPDHGPGGGYPARALERRPAAAIAAAVSAATAAGDATGYTGGQALVLAGGIVRSGPYPGELSALRG